MELNGKKVFEIINSVAHAKGHMNEVSVLPLICGSGKSTAISYMIRQTIEQAESTGNGLLVVTDRKDKMLDYLHPHDIELASFINQNLDKITLMTHENIEESYKEQPFKPVLMLTTQRYFRSTLSEINNLLKWEKGPRPLILIDERPELETIVELNSKKIMDCVKAIEASLQDHYAYGYEIEAALNEFDSFTNNLFHEKRADKENLYCLWSWCNSEVLKEHQDLFNENFKKIARKKALINSYGGGDYYDDIFTRIKAIRLMEKQNALLSQRNNRQLGLMRFELNIMLNNYQLVKEAKAKVIILDGTAALSPEYKVNQFHLYNSSDITRSLDKLRIEIIDIPTSKTRLQSSKDYRQYVADCVELYFSENIAQDLNGQDNDWAMFTYDFFENDLGKRFNKKRIEHFGNIKGKNDYRESKHIIQVGLNRFPDAIYYLYYLEQHPEIANKFDNMNIAAYNNIDIPTSKTMELSEGAVNVQKDSYETVKMFNLDKVISQSEDIVNQMKEYMGQTRVIMNNVLLAEIEQNLFRGKIRNSDCTDEFTFHLFMNKKAYGDLIQLLQDRYGKLGAEIRLSELPTKAMIHKIMRRDGEQYIKKLIEWHDKSLQIGETYTPEKIRQVLGMDKVVDKKKAIRHYERMIARNHKVIRILMSDEQVKKGLYCKIANWQI